MAQAISIPNISKITPRRVLIVSVIIIAAVGYALFGAKIALSRMSAAGAPNTVKAYASGTKVDAGYAVSKLLSALEEKGLNPVPVSSIKRDFFSVTGTIVTISGDNFQAFEYKDSYAASSEATIFKKSASTSAGKWKKRAHLYEKDALLVLYMGNQKNILEALSGFMGAPAPLQ